MKLKFIRYIICFYLAVTSAVWVSGQSAQNYPVSITPVIYPPYPSSVKFLREATSPSLVLTITNKSLNAPAISVRLAVTIECASFSAQTRSVLTTGLAPVTVASGMPVRLTNVDIAAAYDFNNLSGISLSQYENSLPQTKVVYGFILYDAVTNRQVSDKVTYAVINSLNNPPVTTFPEIGANVTEKGMQNVLFQWQPRQLSSAGSVQYILEIIELLDKTQNPQSAFLTNKPFFTDSTFLNKYVFGPAQPPLLSGKSYAWRVKANSYDYGGNQIETFVNQGFSNVASFNYFAACKSPTMVKADDIDMESATVSWFAPSGYDNFRLAYRQKGGSDWKELTFSGVSEFSWGLSGLASNTEYEMKVISVCGSGLDATSIVSTFKTTDKAVEGKKKKINASCGQEPVSKNKTDVLLESLQAKDVIISGDFPIEVGDGVTGQNGYFSGKGVIEIWIGKPFRIPVTFEKIKINKDYEVLEGKIVPATDK